MTRYDGLLLAGFLFILLAGCATSSTPQTLPIAFLGGNVSQPVILPEGIAYTISLPSTLTGKDALRIEGVMRMEGYTLTGKLVKGNETVLTAYNPTRKEQITIRYQYGMRTVHVLVMTE